MILRHAYEQLKEWMNRHNVGRTLLILLAACAIVALGVRPLVLRTVSDVMFLKDETERPPQKNIRLAYADNAEGPWSPPSAPITGDYWAEGPTALRVGERWIVYFDRYRDHTYGALASTDLEHWTDITTSLTMPVGIRHGTAFEVPAADARRLLERERP